MIKEVEKDAYISTNGQHRLYLTRIWDRALPLVGFVMINPSTADATIDDPTIRKCMGYAEKWGNGGIYVVNLFSFRSKDPEDLHAASSEQRNSDVSDFYIRKAAEKCPVVVLGWGANGDPYLDRVAEVYALLTQNSSTQVRCLKVTKSGQPGHPLYLKYEMPLIPWAPILDEDEQEKPDGS